MKMKNIFEKKFTKGVATMAVATLALMPGFAFAQVTTTSGQATMTVAPNTTSYAPGTQDANLATVILRGPVTGTASVSSVNLNLTSTNGANASNLSGCQLYNAGVAVNSSSNIATSYQNGGNTFTFDSPIVLNQSAELPLTLRCDIATNATSGGTFQFAAGGTTSGGTTGGSTTTPAMIGLSANTPASVTASAQDTAIAYFTFDARGSGDSIVFSTLPITASFTGGALPDNLSDCQIRNSTALGTSLTTGTNFFATLLNGMNPIKLDNQLVVPAGSQVTLALTCDVASDVPTTGALTVSIAPGSFPVNTFTNASNSIGVTPTTGVTSTGAVAQTSGTVTFVGGTGVGGNTDPGVPGLPNTGLGGNSMNLAYLLGALALLASGLYAAKRNSFKRLAIR